MPFKESVSKIVKTVEDGASAVAKTVESGASIVAQKSGVLVEISKLNLNIANEEDSIKELYESLGRAVYEDYNNGHITDELMIGDCNEIIKHENNIKELKKKINALKNIKKCQGCGFEMKLNVAYCPKCGLKQEEINKEEVNKVHVEAEYKVTDNEEK